MLPLCFLLISAEPDAITSASNRFEGELGVDYLRANLRSEGGLPLAGTPDSMTAQEAGLRLRFHAEGLGGDRVIDFDYQGREPIGGKPKDSRLRLLYRA